MNNYEKEACLNILTSESGPHKPLVAGSNPAVATLLFLSTPYHLKNELFLS